MKKVQQSERPLWISRQVLREFIVARTRPQTFAKPSTPELIIERVRYLEEHFQVADAAEAVTEQLIKLLVEFNIGGKQVHNANSVATMLAYSIPCLLTHNIKDFQRFLRD